MVALDGLHYGLAEDTTEQENDIHRILTRHTSQIAGDPKVGSAGGPSEAEKSSLLMEQLSKRISQKPQQKKQPNFLQQQAILRKKRAAQVNSQQYETYQRRNFQN